MIYQMFVYSSAEDKRQKIEEVLNTFGRKSRPLILKIIEEDCTNYHRRHKRMMMMLSNVNIHRILSRQL